MSVPYGVVRIAGSDIAITADALQEIVAWPAAIVPHPAAAENVLGMFNLRGRPIPLFDLRRSLGLPASQASERVAILRVGTGRLGIAIDSVADVVRLEEARFSSMSPQSDRPHLFAHMAIMDGRLIYRLDLCALMALPAMFSVQDDQAAARDTARHVRSSRKHYLVFACHGRDFAIDAAAVTELVDKPDLAPADFPGEMCPSIALVRGVRVPVVNLSMLLGLEPLQATQDRPQLMVLSTPAGDRFGFGYDELVSMQRLSTQELGRIPAFGLREADLFAGTFPFGDGRHALLLDHSTLCSRKAIANLAKLYQQGGAEEDAVVSRQRARQQACLLFHAPHQFVAPLGQIQEILPVPRELIPLVQPETHLLGLFELRGEQIPLLSLSGLMEEDPALRQGEAAQVLVVRGARNTFGLAVNSIDAIDTFSQFDSSRLEDAWQAAESRPAAINARARALVSVGSNGRTRMAPLVDLQGLVRDLENRA
jgi:purine-binding chemotaxis protein CheW